MNQIPSFTPAVSMPTGYLKDDIIAKTNEKRQGYDMCNSILIDLIKWFLIGSGAATLTAMIIMPIVLYRQHKEYKEFSARINDKISMNGRATKHRIKL